MPFETLFGRFCMDLSRITSRDVFSEHFKSRTSFRQKSEAAEILELDIARMEEKDLELVESTRDIDRRSVED